MASLKDAMTTELQTYLQQEDRAIPKMMAKLESSTGVKREKIVYTIMGIVAVYLVLGHGAELLCNTIGFAYPAWASFEAIETVDKADDTQWLTYWAVFAAISLVDFASDKIMGVFPIYWLVKCIFLLWLYLPIFRGAEHLCNNVLGPAFKKMHPVVKGDVQQQLQQAAVDAMVQQQVQEGQPQGDQQPMQMDPHQMPIDVNNQPGMT